MKSAEMCFSKTCVNFGRSCGNQGWAEAVENKIFASEISSFKMLESFKSVAQGIVEIFEKVYGGGGGDNVPPSVLDMVKDTREREEEEEKEEERQRKRGNRRSRHMAAAPIQPARQHVSFSDHSAYSKLISTFGPQNVARLHMIQVCHGHQDLLFSVV